MSLTTIARSIFAAAALLSLPISAAAQENPLAPDPLEEEEVETEESEQPEDAAAPAEGVAALTKADVDAWLDGFMPYALEEADIVGAVVTVVKDGEILTSRGFGYSDLENRTPVDGYGTIFRPGSISKLFTWIAVMQLVEQGKIDLDEDVNTYLDFEIPDAFGAPITMRNLMTHTPGFQEKFRNLIIGDPEMALPLEEFLKSSPPPSRIFPPGVTPAYSNYGTALAGYIVQRLSGEPFEEYVERHIFDPLGMERATFRQPLPEQFEPYMSKGYRSASDGEAQYYEIVPMSPAGSMAASGEAMGRFMIGMLERDPAIMKPETWRQMYETIYQLSPPLNAMALGVWELDKGDLRLRGHGGDTSFFHSDLNVALDKNVGIYVSVNSSGEGAGPLRFAVTTRFAQRYFPEATVPVGPRLDTAKEHGALVVGEYESSRTVVTNFAAILRFLGQQKITMNEEGDLVFELFGKPSVWREVEPFVWRHVDGYERLVAVRKESGELDYVTFEPISPIIHLLPAPWYRASSLVTPVLAVALGALALTLVFWPVRALVRWRYKQPFALRGKEAMAYRLARVGAALVFVFIGAWVLTFQSLFSDLSGLGADFDTQLYLTMATQILLYVAMAISLWNVFIVWRGRQSWFAKLWSLVLALAVLVVLLFSALNGLLSWETSF
ncbi:serine hydrolase domain-containing protein [Amphiplicatus metriothermophilus]|uniref:Beta-lactamase n=1 Tax=Amphiplicatus metriothermophilus TaxID=1519374 RepID=A0A239PW18_9PROT|nr:serine hydrolase domain-containing protein [Amphiplicatus metriothermophilus]MBB5518933.1 CubicO group peptidase (beta-lactamase class C family) [Amphiplicatus metriothermophilus]SNT74499.1 Beta-lactamase [Amphiplicatus metriothermophilus]